MDVSMRTDVSNNTAASLYVMNESQFSNFQDTERFYWNSSKTLWKRENCFGVDTDYSVTSSGTYHVVLDNSWISQDMTAKYDVTIEKISGSNDSNGIGYNPFLTTLIVVGVFVGTAAFYVVLRRRKSL